MNPFIRFVFSMDIFFMADDIFSLTCFLDDGSLNLVQIIFRDNHLICIDVFAK